MKIQNTLNSRMTKRTIVILTLNLIIGCANGGLTDYLTDVKSYFGYDSTENQALEGFETKIPYEVAETDEKFISQAIELTGVALSELDACQHRLILKLKSDCHLMNDMQISKLAVGLLNCQSYIEGRKVYPCTEEMSLKSCTSEMDADVWNSYHLMTNRARAVCYSIRHVQFRGLTEHTINRLMEASQRQLHTLGKVSQDQENLLHLAENTIESISKGHQDLAEQQKDLQKAQLFGQLQIEDNINKLADEKRLIIESQRQLAEMTKMLHEKLSIAATQIEKQSAESNSNHNEVLDDLTEIQEKAQAIFRKIDESSNMLLVQSELATKQYQATLEQLKEMNNTVTSLVALVGGTKQELEQRLQWIIDGLGGTDDAIVKLYIILWHLVFLIVSMIASAFMNARFATRLIVISIIPANLALSMLKVEHALDPLTLTGFLAVIVTLQSSAILVWRLSQRKKPLAISNHGTNKSSVSLDRYKTQLDSSNLLGTETPPRTDSRSTNRSSGNRTPESLVYNADVSRFTGYSESIGYSTPHASQSPFRMRSLLHPRRDSHDSLDESRDRFDEFRSPSMSRASPAKSTCVATTRLGTPCRNPVSVGKALCHRHVKGDSVAR